MHFGAPLFRQFRRIDICLHPIQEGLPVARENDDAAGAGELQDDTGAGDETLHHFPEEALVTDINGDFVLEGTVPCHEMTVVDEYRVIRRHVNEV